MLRLIAAATTALFVHAGPTVAAAQDVAPAALVRAAQEAQISRIDSTRECDERSVKDWLKEELGDSARSVSWRGGRCVLAIKERARDAGTRWCAHAIITPKRGKPATIEIYFEKPVRGKPGAPFAFRASVHTKDGPDYMRETGAFEINWKELHVPGYSSDGSPACN